MLAQAFGFETLMNVLERHGLITREGILAEIKRLKEKVRTVR